MRRFILISLVASLPLVGCQDGQFRMPSMDELRTSVGAGAEGDTAAGSSEVASGGGSTGSSGAASSGSSASSGPAGSSGSIAASDDASADGGASAETEGYSGGAAASSGPSNRPEDVDVSGTEENGWTAAEKGWMARMEMTNGMEMIQEVVEAREKLLLMETTTKMNGSVLSKSQAWMARRHPDMTGQVEDHDVDYESEELGSKSFTIGGSSVSAEGYKTITKFDGKAVTGIGWSSKEVPGWMVRSETDAMGNGMEVVSMLVEFRK